MILTTKNYDYLHDFVLRALIFNNIVTHTKIVVTYPVQFKVFSADRLILWILFKSSWLKTDIILCATAKCIHIFFKIYRAIHKKI